MGIQTDRFVDNLPQEALCPICCLVLKEPVSTPCKHYVCQECWLSWRKGASSDLCPYCCSSILTAQTIERSSTIWKLVLNFNVYCKYHKQGCTSIYKLGLEDIHLNNCPYNRNNQYDEDSCTEDEYGNATQRVNQNKCSTCFNTIVDAKNHDCIETLVETQKHQSIKIMNLEYENDRLSLRLTTRENGIMDQISILESHNQQEALNYEKEIRQLKTRIATLYGELKKYQGEIEEVDINVSLERQDGSLGLNIVGGHQDGKEASGIFISRIAEDGPASQPGKLQLNDRVLEVNGVNLTDATHDQAVQAFKNSHGPVLLLVRRQVTIGSRKLCKWTQTDAETNNNNNESSSSLETVQKSSDNTDSALPSGSEADDSPVLVNDSGTRLKGDVYDSAYDTLLTQKSSRSSREYSLDESQLKVPLRENEDISSECSEEIRTLTPGSDMNCYRSSSSSKSHRIDSPQERNTMPRRGSLSTDDSLSPVHGVKMRQKNNSDGGSGSPKKVIRRSTYYLVEESLEEMLKNANELNGERKLSLENEGSMTQTSNEVEYEYEYEHVTVRNENGRLGMQLCYGGEEDAVGVYVSKVENSCMVEGGGRVMVGDQLIQINNNPVHNVEEACKILQNNENVALVVARPVIEASDQSSIGVTMKKDEGLLNTVLEGEAEVDISSSEPSTVYEQFLGSSTEKASATEYFSENSRTKVSHDSSPTGSQKEASKCSEKRDKNLRFECKSETKSEIRDEVRSSLKDYVLSRLRGHDKHKNNKESDSDKTMSTPEKVKDRTLERNGNSKNNTPISTPSSSRRGSASSKEKRVNSRCNSPAVGGSDSNNTSPVRELNSNPARPTRSAMKKATSKHRSPKHVRMDPKPDWTLTEKRVWEEFKIIQNMEAEEGEKDQEANLSSVEAEWKVRRSKDGKHIYIRKHSTKPQKSKLLKERAERLAFERTGVTTDDDANTIYLGRFWNKEERKRQLLRHRLKRERIIEKQLAKDSIAPNPMDSAMAEIVQKKMTAPGHVFDDFVTVEEILTQRNRDGILEGPIHVTTV